MQKWVTYLDDEQRRHLNDQRGIRRILGLATEKIGGMARWITWRLWGRRRAIKRMRELALSGGGYYSPPSYDREESRLKSHREHLDSLKVEPIPTPDSHDVN